MVNAEVTAIIAGASAFAGGVIVAISNYVINRVQATDARKAELRRALIDLGDIVSRIDHRLRIEPEPGKTSRAINEAISTHAPQFDHAIGLLRRRLLDPHLDDLTAAMSRSLSTTMVLAPPNLLPAPLQGFASASAPNSHEHMRTLSPGQFARVRGYSLVFTAVRLCSPLIGAAGFEPAIPAPQMRCDTRLRHAPL
jgi:hypothetical protein